MRPNFDYAKLGAIRVASVASIRVSVVGAIHRVSVVGAVYYSATVQSEQYIYNIHREQTVPKVVIYTV